MNILEFIPLIFMNYSRIFMNYSWSRKQGQSRHIHSLAYRQISILKNFYKYTFFLEQSYIRMHSQPSYLCFLVPTLAQFSNAVYQVLSAFVPRNIRFCFNLLTKLTPFSHCTNSFHPLCTSFIPVNPFQHLLYRNPIWCPPWRLRSIGRKKERDLNGTSNWFSGACAWWTGKLGPSLKHCLFAVPLPCIFWLGR